ncbi:hypothetical protein BaRGS_00007010, partial [Batillaria attramentaria]
KKKYLIGQPEPLATRTDTVAKSDGPYATSRLAPGSTRPEMDIEPLAQLSGWITGCCGVSLSPFLAEKATLGICTDSGMTLPSPNNCDLGLIGDIGCPGLRASPLVKDCCLPAASPFWRRRHYKLQVVANGAVTAMSKDGKGGGHNECAEGSNLELWMHY